MSDSGQRVRHFFTKVVGVTHTNSDRTDRQRIIARCSPLEKLTLDHDEDNPVDPNAVKVCRENGQQIGYLNADLAEDVVRQSNQGYRFSVFIKDLTGGTKAAPTRGVNLLVVVADPGVRTQEAQNYVESLINSDSSRPRVSAQQTARMPVDSLAIDEENSDSGETPNFPAMRRRLLVLQVRHKLRAFCDATGLGSSFGERACCVLIASVIPFAISFGLSFAFRQPAGFAACQGVGSFTLFAVAGLLLIGRTPDDELDAVRIHLAAELPDAEVAWREHKERERERRQEHKERERERRQAARDAEPNRERSPVVHPTHKRCPFCRETIFYRAIKCKHCGELLDDELREERQRAGAAGRSPGTAVALEFLFGFFFSTFGVGHIYNGMVGTGLLLMFGWWGFVLCGGCCGLLSGGLLFLIVPAAWCLLLIVAPISAAGY